jgi:hypothetical protein
MSWTERNWDHERDLRTDWDLRQAPPMSERAAVASLVGYCESLCGNGTLGELVELGLRQHIAQTLAAFKMPSKEELKR